MELIGGDLADQPPATILNRLDAIAAETDATIQAFDARYIVSARQLTSALEFADRAIERGKAIADDRSVEILLYAAGRRQINRALELGLKDHPHPVVIVVDGGDEPTARAAIRSLFTKTRAIDGSDADHERIARYFDIGDAERSTGASLEHLVLERVALLTVNR